MSRLLKCKEHGEVFVVEDRKKCWIRNPDTFVYLGYRWEDVETITFEDLRDNYEVGPTKELVTVEKIIEGKKPQDMFYPVKEENPWRHVRGLLTLNPLPPSGNHIEDLGFNLLVPYGSTVSGWKGDIITRSMRPGKVVARFTNDEPDCRKHNPDKELELYKKMKEESPDILIGSTLCGDIGCGWDPPGYTKKEWQDKWIEIGNQMDFLILDVYPYRKPQYQGGRTPLEEMEMFHKRFQETVTVPIIMCIQAHNTYPDQIRPNPMEEVRFWVERGYGYIVYPWNNQMKEKPNPTRGVIDMQEEWKQANEWAASQV